MSELVIKGLTNFHQYQFNNINYYFLGDIHIQKNLCDYQCDHMVDQFKKLVVENENCTDITAFIYEWLNYNVMNNIKTNFSFLILKQLSIVSYSFEAGITENALLGAG